MILGISASNLLSFQTLEIDIPSGITMITGYNHDDGTEEAAGKSAMPNIASWVLFGKIPKDAKIDDVIRAGAKSGEGTVRLTNGYSVTRSRKPNSLYMTKDKEKIVGKDAKETQQLIEDMLGMSFETFCQAVYFAQNYPNKFVTATEEDKAKILAEIDDLSQFDRAKKLATQKSKTLETLLSSLNLKLTHARQTKLNLQVSLESLTKIYERQESERLARISRLSTDLEQASAVLIAKTETLKALEDAAKDLESEKEELNEKLTEASAEMSVLQKAAMEVQTHKARQTTIRSRISKAETDLQSIANKLSRLLNPGPTNSCPTCGSDLSKADEATIQKHLEELTTQANQKQIEMTSFEDELKEAIKNTPDIESSQIRIKDLTEASSKIRSRISQIDKAYLDSKRAAQEVEFLANSIVSLQRELEDAKLKTTQDITETLEKTKSQLEDVEIQLEALSRENEVAQLEFSRLGALRDAFKEVKSFAFRNTLAELTSKANFYLSQLFNQEVRIEFSNEGDGGELSKISCRVTIDGEERPLSLYSGGQFRRIQLSVDLALSDLISSRNKNSINFRIFDEVMKDLSETSMENVLNLFKSLKGSTLLIEHNSLFKSIVNNVVRVELRNGISEIVSNF